MNNQRTPCCVLNYSTTTFVLITLSHVNVNIRITKNDGTNSAARKYDLFYLRNPEGGMKIVPNKIWICIYPAYINSKKTLAEGRRIPKDKCVDNPTYQEIRDILLAAGMKIGVENKLYSRERSKEMLHRGRIRVQIKEDDGSPVDANLNSREAVMLHLCQMIPKLKTRSGKQSGNDQTSSGGASGGGQGGGSKKKGKGRR